MSTSDQHNEQQTSGSEEDLHADGIVENRETKPPGYFNLLYFGLIIWGVIFMAYYLLSGWSSDEEFTEKMAAHKSTYVAQVVTPELGQAVAISSEDGAALFADNCAQCHGDKGNNGFVELDLTSETFKYGRSVDSVKNTIKNGREGGMPTYASQLSGAEVDALVTYVLQLR